MGIFLWIFNPTIYCFVFNLFINKSFICMFFNKKLSFVLEIETIPHSNESLHVIFDDWTLKKNNRRLLVVIWCFIIVYSSWSVQDICVILFGYKNFFVANLVWLLINLANYLPIFLVLYTHFKNMQSF